MGINNNHNSFNQQSGRANRSGSAESFLIPYAIDQQTGAVVRLPHDYLRTENDVHYDEAAHKGKLQCPDCEATVHFNKGNPSRGGDNLMGQSAHFHTNPGQTHKDECRVRSGQLAREDRDVQKIDSNKGFVINLNSFQRQDDLFGAFSKAARGPYMRGDDKRMHLLDKYRQEFSGMERISIRSVQDFADFLRTKSIARIRESVVVHRGHVIQWDNFLLFKNRREGLAEEDRDSRIKNFVKRLRPNQEIPCLIEIELKEGAWPKNTYQALCVKPEGVRDGFDPHTGRPNYILPRIYVENDMLRYEFSQAGRYLVLGYARRSDLPAHSPKNKSGNNMVFLNMRVDDHAQVAKGDILELARENRRRNSPKTQPDPAPTPLT